MQAILTSWEERQGEQRRPRRGPREPGGERRGAKGRDKLTKTRVEEGLVIDTWGQRHRPREESPLQVFRVPGAVLEPLVHHLFPFSYPQRLGRGIFQREEWVAKHLAQGLPGRSGGPGLEPTCDFRSPVRPVCSGDGRGACRHKIEDRRWQDARHPCSPWEDGSPKWAPGVRTELQRFPKACVTLTGSRCHC